MALIDTIQTTDATKPSALSQVSNGQLPDSWLRAPDGSTRTDYKAFVPVSYAIQAMHLAAADAGIQLRTTGRYRSLARQEALFAERYRSGSANNDGCGSKVYNGVTYYLQRSDKGGCMAMAATPGTSNHGWGIADDFSEWDTGDPSFGSSLDLVDLGWLANNARSFFFALDTRSEPWHWHWYNPANPNTLSQRTVDVLNAKGIKVPSLATWGFTVPGGGPTPTPTPSLPPKPTTTGDEMFLIAKVGGTPTTNWGGWFSNDAGATRKPVTSMAHAATIVDLGALDAQTRQRVTDREWDGVSHTTSTATLDSWLTPYG